MKVIAVEFIVKPEQADAFLAAMLRHAANSLAEPGCRRFDVARDPDNPGRFLLWENYVDEAAVAFHREQASMAELRDATADMVLERNISLVEMVDRGAG